MRPLHKAILGGVAAVALVGAAGLAAAAISNVHVLDVRLPDGAVAQVRYLGDTPPTLRFATAPTAFSVLAPEFDLFATEPSFAALERVSEAMDRQAEAMFRSVGAPSDLAPGGAGLTHVELGTLPPGGRSFSIVSTMTANGVCTRSVQYRSNGDGKPPQVETRLSGACAADQERPAPAAEPRSQSAQPGRASGRSI